MWHGEAHSAGLRDGPVYLGGSWSAGTYVYVEKTVKKSRAGADLVVIPFLGQD